jgi:predicted nucleic acid-binding protein
MNLQHAKFIKHQIDSQLMQAHAVFIPRRDSTEIPYPNRPMKIKCNFMNKDKQYLFISAQLDST